MKNKKSFRIIEISALAIFFIVLVLLIFPFFHDNIDTFRNDYYNQLGTDIIGSAKKYFSDNEQLLPDKYMDSQIVNLKTLNDKKYIEKVKDYNGAGCDINNSYVIAVKRSDDEYEYTTCLKCNGDNYDSTDNKYCSDGWNESKGHTEISYLSADKVYVYKGISLDRLKQQVVSYPSIIRCLGTIKCDKVLDETSGQGEEGIEPIYPVNMDSIDVNTPGVYKVKYEYKIDDNNIKTYEGEVEVYEYKDFDITLQKKNEYYNTNNDSDDLSLTVNKVTERTSNYVEDNDNEWAQKLIVTLSYEFPRELLDLYSNKGGLFVAKYQWNIGGKWEDFCIPNAGSNTCITTITKSMNQNVRFRLVDTLGNISKESKSYSLRVEKVKTFECTLKTKGEITDKGWYVSDVEVSIDYKDDRVIENSPYNGATLVKSGIKETGVSKKKKVINDKDYETKDGKVITWYGYVEDNANNFNKCSITFKRDTKAPICVIKGHANISCTDETSGIVKVTFTKTQGYDGGETFSPKTAWKDNSQKVTEKGTWYLRAVDDAGRVTEIPTVYSLITYDSNGGSTPSVKSVIKRETEKVPLNIVTKKDGYKMIGWNTNPNAINTLDEYKAQPKEDDTLYAIYEKCDRGLHTNDLGDKCIK